MTTPIPPIRLFRRLFVFTLFICFTFFKRLKKQEVIDIDAQSKDQSGAAPVPNFRFSPSSFTNATSKEKSSVHEGEYVFPRTITRVETLRNMPKTVLYITTHFSEQHKWHLQNCWPQALNHSSLLRNSDIIVYLTPSNREQAKDALLLLNTVFANQRMTVHVRTNKAKQEGAMVALAQATQLQWFAGYDWVIRLNPDVIVRDDSLMVDTMMNDHNATALLIKCQSIKPGALRKLRDTVVHTDFFAVKPEALPRTAFLHPSFADNAEISFTDDIKPILESGGQRWIEEAFPVDFACRVGGGKSLSKTPITHYHVNTSDFACPIPFL